MSYKPDDKKVLMAIDRIIKDIDKKYDECLVDHFLTFIEEELDMYCYGDVRTKALLTLFDRLKSFMDHPAFVMLNQARALKVFDRTLTRVFTLELNLFIPHLESLWKILGTIIVNQNSAAMAVMFSTLQQLVESNTGFYWLIDKKIEPPVIIQGNKVSDITSLLQFYIKTSTNYHTKNKAEKLFEALTVNAFMQEFSPTHPLVLSIKSAIRDITLVDTASMAHMLSNMTKDTRINRKQFLDRYDIPEIMQESLTRYIERPSSDLRKYLALCKCLALTNSSDNFIKIFEKLKSYGKLEGIIVYLCRSNCKERELHQLLPTCLLYPLLTKCYNDDSQVLINKLIATREERDFIERNMSDKLITICLVSLRQMMRRKKNCDSYENNYNFPHRALMLTFNTLTNYIKCHHDAKNFKNVMECCSILKTLCISDAIDRDALNGSIEGLYCVLESIEIDTEQAKSIIMEVIRVLRAAQLKYTMMIFSEAADKSLLSWNRTVELAFKFDDHDILNEFVLSLTNSLSINGLNFPHARSSISRYLDLIWNHIYQNAKNTDHRELLGNLAHLLIEIDIDAEPRVFEEINIHRHHEIPMLLGDILIHKSPVLPTVERVVDAIHARYLTSYSAELSASRLTVGYVSRLDSPTLPSSVKDNLDHLALGLCITIRGEASESHRHDCLTTINALIREMITNSDDSEYLLKRLVRTGILETLYDIITGTMYSRSWYETAKSRIGLITTGVLSSLAKADELIVNLIMSSEHFAIGTISQEQRLARAKSIAEFYTLKTEYKREVEASWVQTSDKMELSSMVDDILNYELISDGISDCY